jgi:RHS repeat-associated protein
MSTTLDDLTAVTQGSQTRSFTYDSLKRLKQAINPESGTINYTSYDANSNLLTKQDARSITTTYVYDALNRVISRTYTNDPQNTPAVSYKYDNQTLPTGAPTFTRGSSIGRLVAVTYGGTSAGSYQGYDQLGRVNVSYQQTDSINYSFGYGYNLASEMTSETYPSGRQVITEYDSAGRAAGIRSAAIFYAGARAIDATHRIQYAPHGAVSVMKFDNDLWEHTLFNNRLQPTQIGLGTSGTDSSVMKLDYGYGTTANNGNVTSQTITTPSLTVNQCYGYDSLNRLSSAEERSAGTVCGGTQQWKQAFTYDRFGNRNFDLANTTSNVLGPNPTITTSTNRIASGQNYGYDNAGNLTSDPTTPVNGVVYDAENRQTQYTKSGQATNSYYYDGDGHRVKKIDSTGTTVFVYDAGGQLIAEYTAGNPSNGGTSYLTSDHLGSTRVVIKSDGTTTRHDYLPFGEEIQAGIGGRTGQGYVADGVRQKFTQKERDIESGLDYFLARYYSSTQGRFTSPDPIFISDQQASSPQLWNLYNYAGNNPLAYTDPTGMELVQLGQHTDEEIKRRQAEIKQQRQDLKKDKSISNDERKAQEKALKAENNTLGLEMEGNRVGNALLASLDAKGERNGLKLSDLTFSTDSKHDFDQDKRVSDDPGKGAGMFVLNGYSRQIYLNRKSSDYSLYESGDSDGVLYGGTALRHEQVHRDNYPRGDTSEHAAYSLQLKLLQQYGPGAFKSRDFYATAIEHVSKGSKRKD